MDGTTILLTGFLVISQILPDLNMQSHPGYSLPPPAATSSDSDKKAFREQKLAFFRAVCEGFIQSRVGSDPDLNAAFSEFGREKLDAKAAEKKGQNLDLVPGMTYDQAVALYHLVCDHKDNPDLVASIDWQKPFDYFNELKTSKLPPYRSIREKIWPQSIEVRDRMNAKIGDIYDTDDKEKRGVNRVWVSNNEIPALLRQAFVASEDKNFFTHKGFEVLGLMRAMLAASDSGKIIGGSTITQQLAKNALLSGEQTLERKYKELLLSDKIEHDPDITKDEILNQYLNLIYFGREAYGVKKAAENWFNKSLQDLSVSEIAFIAGIVQSPSANNKQPFYKKAIERRNYVINRLVATGKLDFCSGKKAKLEVLTFAKRSGARHYLQSLDTQVRKVLPPEIFHTGGLVAHTTLDHRLQESTEAILADQLFDVDYRVSKRPYPGPLQNVETRISEIQTDFEKMLADDKRQQSETDEIAERRRRKFGGINPESTGSACGNDGVADPKSAWRWALAEVSNPVPDVYWELAVVLGFKGKHPGVGILSGETLQLHTPSFLKLDANLRYGDVVWIKRDGDKAELRAPPEVQGAVVALDTNSGDILAYAGGFSFFKKNFDHVSQANRPPGSIVKPMVYLEGLQRGLQPNSMYMDAAGMASFKLPNGKTWTPGNFNDDYTNRKITVRAGLEQSKNQIAAQIFQGFPTDGNGHTGLDYVIDDALEYSLYSTVKNDEKVPSFILGTIKTTPLNVATAFARIGNLGLKVKPLYLLSIDGQNGAALPQYAVDRSHDGEIHLADSISRYQLRYLMQGVISRGTAAAILGQYSDYLAGKTGTTQDNKDVWFAGTSPTVTIAVWIGYDDNSNLGNGSTGGTVATPVFKDIFERAKELYGEPQPFGRFPGVDYVWIDKYTGGKTNEGSHAVLEAFRSDGSSAPSILKNLTPPLPLFTNDSRSAISQGAKP